MKKLQNKRNRQRISTGLSARWEVSRLERADTHYPKRHGKGGICSRAGQVEGLSEQQIDISYDLVGILPASLLIDLQNGETA